MKSPCNLTTLIATGAFALALSLSAQNPAGVALPASGKNPGVVEKSPLPTPPARPNAPPHDPRVSAPPAAQKEGTGLTPGAANSGSGVGGRETLRPDPASPLDKASSRPVPKGVGSPGSPQFNTMDADRDGRISLTEFTAPSSAWLRHGAAGAGVSAGSGASATAPAGSRDAKSVPGSAGPLAGPSSATDNARLFQQADTNRDGYLSPAELDTYRAPTTSER